LIATSDVEQRDRLAEICRRFHIRKLALFGSVLRPDFNSESDVDVLVDFAPGHTPSFFRLHEIEEALSAVFGGCKIDLVTYRALNPLLRASVLAEAQVQYIEKRV
jgi:hypothetical protein